MAAVIAPPGIGAYAATKHAVLGLSDVLRAELTDLGVPVGVSVVMPGRIQTGMNPVGTVPAAEVAANVLDGMRRNRPYVFTDHHSSRQVEARLGAIVAARAEVLPTPD
jgi:short-subunit dehydrogenase